MNNGKPLTQPAQPPELRSTTMIPAVQWQILTRQAAPPGQRVLQAVCPFAIYVFPMSIEDAQNLGRALSAPGVSVPS